MILKDLLMNYYIGIDLGTTNSSIAIYDGENINICKSPEQNDVTPSAIIIDKRGNKFIGKRAYDIAPLYPDNSAQLFKRLMGSNTKITFASNNETKTPEECSAEVIKVLFGYLPEEIRKSENLGCVITIPAAFNQMQKDSTVKAANLAGLGKVALMQEPVAAVMSVIRHKNTDGIFLIYDLGGGTLDIAIAENNSGRVSLLANGGIQMCGGRDIDRFIFDSIVKPWLIQNFNLNKDFTKVKKYKKLERLSYWAIERAKIELSSKEEANIVLNEMETGITDESDEEIYLDIVLTRTDIAPFIDEIVKESIAAINETLAKASLRNSDIERIVFIGGPTNYKPLRDKLCNELNIKGSNEINPMTAVAEGAAIFAESLDWSSFDNTKKSNKGKVTSDFGDFQLSFAYTARTPEYKAKVRTQFSGKIPENCEFQIDSLDSDWSSGRQKLINGTTLSLNLPKNGENTFKVFVFNENGSLVNIPNNKIIITRTAATIDAITASHSIGVAVKDNNSYITGLEWLIKAGDNLPKKGKAKFKAAEALIAGSKSSLNFKLFEGEIQDPVTDNRDIGTFKIRGTDLERNINIGTELICEYEMLDSGNIILHVSVPSLGIIIDSSNFYSPQEGQIDFNVAAERISFDARKLKNRIDDIESFGVEDSDLTIVHNKINRINELTSSSNDVEKNQEAQEKLLEAKKLLYKIRKNHINDIRRMELNYVVEYFEDYVKKEAKNSEIATFEAMKRTAKLDIERNNKEFENTLFEMKVLNFIVMNRQDWFVINRFKKASDRPYNYCDTNKYKMLIIKGEQCIINNDITALRKIMYELSQIRIDDDYDFTSLEDVNIKKG